MTERKEFRDLAPPEEAHTAIDSLDLAPESEHVPLEDARGRVLSERVDADLDVPGFDRASMDGYAVRARDTFGADEADPDELELVGSVHAGSTPDVTVDPGTCAEISTGAVMPEGADAVVMVERTEELFAADGDATATDGDATATDGDATATDATATDATATDATATDATATTAEAGDRPDRIAIRTSVTPGDNVMVAGADIAAGARALGPGTRLTPREIGLLSALGIDEAPVRGTPKVGIISTGDELVRPGEPLDSDRGQIYDVNSTTIAAGVEEAGGEPVLYPHAGDDYGEMERLLTRAADECDLVLSSGSTSASAVDVIYRVIEDRGELLLHGVAIKPGKPMLIGRLDRSAESTRTGASAYVGLPGYPVSALTIFRTFVAPAIREAAGQPEPRTATVTGEMGVSERYTEGRTRLMPVGLLEREGHPPLVYPVDKGSGATTSLVEADGVVRVDPDTEYLDEGESVDVTLFSPDVRPPTLLGVGEDDPALNRILDRVDRPRYLPVGSREGLRRLRGGLPDVAVTAGPVERDVDSVELGRWRREWGLVVPAGNPADVAGVADLVDSDLRFVNRTTDSGLRTSLATHVGALADERGVDRHELVDAIEGFDLTVRAFESPARRVASGDADVGIGLHATAEQLDLGFVSLGTQDVVVRANPDRVETESVADLEAALDDLTAVVDALPGYDA